MKDDKKLTIQEILEGLHYSIGKNLLDALDNGSADSKDISNAIKYLKDNNFILEKETGSDPLLALQDIINVEISKPKELPHADDVDDIINGFVKNGD